MNAPLRFNPLADAQAASAQAWTTVNAMQVVAAYGGDAESAAVAGIGDLSWLRRFGCKGPGAAAWLAVHGIEVPALANQWLPLADGATAVRLGRSEFLIEDGEQGGPCAALFDAPAAAGVHPVLRQDAAFVVCGRRVGELLRQVCSVDFASVGLAARPVVLTSMAGIGVTVLPFGAGDGHAYRVWCDGTYGAWLWKTLVEIARELGGGPVGLDALR